MWTGPYGRRMAAGGPPPDADGGDPVALLEVVGDAEDVLMACQCPGMQGVAVSECQDPDLCDVSCFLFGQNCQGNREGTPRNCRLLRFAMLARWGDETVSPKNSGRRPVASRPQSAFAPGLRDLPSRST